MRPALPRHRLRPRRAGARPAPALRRPLSRAAGLAAALALALLLSLLAPRPALAWPAPLRGVALVDQHEKPLGGGDWRGQPTLLHFIFTGCTSTCSPQVQSLVQLHDQLPPSVQQRLRVVSVTVDPAHDRPQDLRAYAQRQGAERSGWAFATGPVAQVEGLVQRMQVLPKPGPGQGPASAADHRNAVYLFDAQGQLVQRFGAAPLDTRRLALEITRLTRVR